MRYRRGPILAISTSRRSSISASTESSRSSPETVAEFGRRRLQPLQRRGAERAAQHLDLELVQHVERGPPALDRAALSLGRVVLALQRDQRVDAADGAERCRRLRRLRRLALVDRETAGRGAARRGRVRNLAVAFDPKMRMSLTLAP